MPDGLFRSSGRAHGLEPELLFGLDNRQGPSQGGWPGGGIPRACSALYNICPEGGDKLAPGEGGPEFCLSSGGGFAPGYRRAGDEIGSLKGLGEEGRRQGGHFAGKSGGGGRVFPQLLPPADHCLLPLRRHPHILPVALPCGLSGVLPIHRSRRLSLVPDRPLG